MIIHSIARRHLLRAFHRAIRPIFDPYRPELHYMRGPGPKWREKHGQDDTPELETLIGRPA